MIPKKNGGPPPSKAYFDLVKKFPLLPIGDENRLRGAMEMLDHVLTMDCTDPGVQGYLDVLTDIVEAYEREHLEIPDASEAEVLGVLMEMRGINQTELEKATGVAQETISNILRGVRSLNKKQIEAFSVFFNIGPSAFFPAPRHKSAG